MTSSRWPRARASPTRPSWREAHERFWNGYIGDLRTGLRDPGFELTDLTVVVCEWFRVVERLDGAA